MNHIGDGQKVLAKAGGQGLATFHAGQDERQLVVFTVGAEHYAVDIGRVSRVVLWTEPTPLPEAPAGVLGVINLYGQVVPVVDLGVRFARQRLAPAGEARVMIVEVSGRAVGLVVDDVLEVAKVQPDQIDPPATATASGMVTGIARRGNRLVILLDVDRVVGSAASLSAPAAS